MRLRHLTPMQKLEYCGFENVEEVIAMIDRGCTYLEDQKAIALQTVVPELSYGRYRIVCDFSQYRAKVFYIDTWKNDDNLVRTYKKCLWMETHK